MALKETCSSLGLAAAVLSSFVACTDAATSESAAYVSVRSTVDLGGGAELETIAAARGAVGLDTAAQGSALTGPGVVTITRAAFDETVERQADGFEQSWAFARAPGSDGDLVIELEARGLDPLGTTPAGLVFRAGALDVRYGNGTWIDAGGARSVVPARYDAGRILLTVPAAVVSRSSFPAVLDPKILVTPITT